MSKKDATAKQKNTTWLSAKHTKLNTKTYKHRAIRKMTS